MQQFLLLQHGSAMKMTNSHFSDQFMLKSAQVEEHLCAPSNDSYSSVQQFTC